MADDASKDIYEKIFKLCIDFLKDHTEKELFGIVNSAFAYSGITTKYKGGDTVTASRVVQANECKD